MGTVYKAQDEVDMLPDRELGRLQVEEVGQVALLETGPFLVGAADPPRDVAPLYLVEATF